MHGFDAILRAADNTPPGRGVDRHPQERDSDYPRGAEAEGEACGTALPSLADTERTGGGPA